MSRLKPNQYLYTVYKDKRGKWRWRKQAANYYVIDASTQGYSSRRYAVNDAMRYGAPAILLEGHKEAAGSVSLQVIV